MLVFILRFQCNNNSLSLTNFFLHIKCRSRLVDCTSFYLYGILHSMTEFERERCARKNKEGGKSKKKKDRKR